MTPELRSILIDMRSVVVAFSGGVDSAYLAWAATDVLGDNALCVTAESASYPEHHRQLALKVARECHLHHEIISTGEIERAEYRANPENRCYFCKHELYTRLTALARDRGFAYVADGTNADDRGDYRPGRVAAKQFGVRSRHDEGRDSRAVAARRAARVGRARVGVPLVAHSVSSRGDPREAASDRARRRSTARTGIPRVPRAPLRHAGQRRAGGRGSRARALHVWLERARSSQTCRARSCANCRPPATSR